MTPQWNFIVAVKKSVIIKQIKEEIPLSNYQFCSFVLIELLRNLEIWREGGKHGRNLQFVSMFTKEVVRFVV